MRLLFAGAVAGVTAMLAPVMLVGQQPASSPMERIRLAAADSAYNDGNRVLAQRYYASVLEMNPKNSRAVYQLGQLAKDDATEAVARFREYVTLEPRDPWGHIALAQALARTTRLDEALVELDSAQRLAPAERDVRIGRARILAQANRTDASIAQYERWTVRQPDDAEAWRELAAQLSKAGEIAGAIRALEKAQARHPTPAAERRLNTLRAMAAPWTEPIAEGSRDSDGNGVARGGLTIGALLGNGLGINVRGAATHVGEGPLGSTVYDAAVGARWRPTAALRLEGRAGAALSDSVISVGHRLQPIGELRIDWRDPGSAAFLNLRASRAAIAASPLLVANNVVRDEVGGRLDVTVAGPVRIRALARDGYLSSVVDHNNRIALGGGLILAGAIGELSATVQQITYAHQSTAGYFSPQLARVLEVGTYAEFESANGVRLSLDAGAGAQQVTQWGLPAGPWGPAYRSWTELAVPVALGSEVRFAIESYDSRIGSDVATSSTWRYLSLSLTLHWALP
jgi:Flp pilus assembly protein TadD